MLAAVKRRARTMRSSEPTTPTISRRFHFCASHRLGGDDQVNDRRWYGSEAGGSFGHGHNYLAYFHDGICVCTHGSPEEEQSKKSVAIDIYNNDIFLVCDDFIEADGGTHNIRVLRNRGFNAAHHGLSAQPVFG